MSRSIIYNGHDFGAFSTAEVTHLGAVAQKPHVQELPCRDGALLLRGHLQPRTIRVRLMLDAGYKLTASELAALRHAIAGWLAADGGGTLVLPDEPELAYHDVICTDAGAWSGLGNGEGVDLTFAAYDPVAYGASASASTAPFAVGGNWPTFAKITVTALAASFLRIKLTDTGEEAYVSGTFTGGETVIFDPENMNVKIGSEWLPGRLGLGSSYFRVPAGDVRLTLTNCAFVSAQWQERWV